MANENREPFVLDFPNGQRVEDILKKADADYSKAEIDAKMASKATMSDVQRETQNLQNQINEIVRAPESGGDVAAEVAQARVNAEGVSYTTLKERIDSTESELRSSVSETQDALRITTDTIWESGNIDLSGVEQTSTTRARTDGYVSMTASVSVDSGAYSYRFYNSSGTFTESTDWITTESVPNNVKTNANSAKCRLVYKSASGGAVSAADASANMTIGTVQNPFVYTDSKLSVVDSIVSELHSALISTMDVEWESGNIDLSGVEQTSTTRARTTDYLTLDTVVSVSSLGAYSYRFYSSSGTYTESTDWLTTETTASEQALNANSTKYRLVFKLSAGGTVVVKDIKDIVTVKGVISPFDAIDDINSELNVVKQLSTTWELGHIGNSGSDTSANNRIREKEMLLYSEDTNIVASDDIKYVIRTYDINGDFVKGTSWQTGNGTVKQKYRNSQIPTGAEYYYRMAVAYSDDRVVDDVATLAAKIDLSVVSTLTDVRNQVDDNTNRIAALERGGSTIVVNRTGLGNCSIRCAKEISYTDGSAPQIEFFLLEEPNTGKFYYSKDLKSKQYMFTFAGDAYKYSFGVLQNGDIIACLDADAIATETKSDSNRQNPYVFLASEGWSVQHEVDFGNSLKPCGWLENCGFKVLADGSAIFCEYTRQTTYSANAWKLSGDPTNASNWTATQSFVITTTDNANNFKHCHCVMQDFYTGVCYLATGDSDKGAMLFASTDNGSTWTQLLSPDSAEHEHEEGFAGGSEKYCRMLMMNFTEDYIYWASDTAVEVNHYLFKAERDNDGVLDYSTVQEVVNIPAANHAATYGSALIPEWNAILLLERTDAAEQEMPIRLITLSDSQLHTIGKFEVCPDLAQNGANLGFRTRFSEWYPYNGLVRAGYAMRMTTHNNAVNQNKGFGNEGHTSTGNGTLNINNLFLQLYNNGSFGFHLGTYYI